MNLIELLQIASSGVLKTFDSCPIWNAKNKRIYKWDWGFFWSYAKEKLLKFHCVSKDNFIYYLKELEFRYNFRDNINDNLYKCLSGINWVITRDFLEQPQRAKRRY